MSKSHIARRSLFGKNIPRWTLVFWGFLIAMALFANVIANNKPIICKQDGKIVFPVFQSPAQLSTGDAWKNQSCQWALWPIIRFLPEDIDLSAVNTTRPMANCSKNNTRGCHYLGTDELGRDVASGLIHGAALSIKIGLLSMALALLIGILLGGLSGYYGNNQLKVNLYIFLPLTLIVLTISYWLLTLHALNTPPERLWRWTLILGLLSVGFMGMKWLASRYRKNIRLPLDQIIQGFIQLFSSVPGGIILLVILTVIGSPSVLNVILVIGLLTWPRIANLTRAETIRTRNSPFIHAAKLKGLSDGQIFFWHVLPSVWPSVMIPVILGIGSAILMEATISFLGLGLGAQHVTWGSQLASARNHIHAWWLMVFPGIFLFLTVYSLHLIAKGIRKQH